MIIGVPKEIKESEDRVSLIPQGVPVLKELGHHVLVQRGAGEGSGFPDEMYIAVGAELVQTAGEIWQRAEMIVKVKEPLESEYTYFREDLILFTYLHLASNISLTQAIQNSGMTAIAYETVQLSDGSLPLLTPMSEIAGRMSVQVGAHFLESHYHGKGILLSGVPGVAPGDVLIIGGGTVGTNAAKIAMGLGARVTVMDTHVQRLRELDDIFGGRIRTIVSNDYHIAAEVPKADLLIGAVLVPGARAPKVVKRETVAQMERGSVIVDVAIDQGGSIETIDHFTTHAHPVYEKEGVLHYAVANIPGAVPRTATIALTNVTFPYIIQLAQYGMVNAVQQDEALARGVNVMRGAVVNSPVAEAAGMPYISLKKVLQWQSTARMGM